MAITIEELVSLAEDMEYARGGFILPDSALPNMEDVDSEKAFKARRGLLGAALSRSIAMVPKMDPGQYSETVSSLSSTIMILLAKRIVSIGETRDLTGVDGTVLLDFLENEPGIEQGQFFSVMAGLITALVAVGYVIRDRGKEGGSEWQSSGQ